MCSLYEKCYQMISQLSDRRYSAIFINPVDTTAYPDYRQIITHPMDLQTISQNITQQQYNCVSQIQRDLNLISSNCRRYCKGKQFQSNMLKTVSAFQKGCQAKLSKLYKFMRENGISADDKLVKSVQISLKMEKMRMLQSKQYKIQRQLKSLECQESTPPPSASYICINDSYDPELASTLHHEDQSATNDLPPLTFTINYMNIYQNIQTHEHQISASIHNKYLKIRQIYNTKTIILESERDQLFAYQKLQIAQPQEIFIFVNRFASYLADCGGDLSLQTADQLATLLRELIRQTLYGVKWQKTYRSQCSGYDQWLKLPATAPTKRNKTRYNLEHYQLSHNIQIQSSHEDKEDQEHVKAEYQSYCNRSNALIIKKYHKRLEINWNKIVNQMYDTTPLFISIGQGETIETRFTIQNQSS